METNLQEARSGGTAGTDDRLGVVRGAERDSSVRWNQDKNSSFGVSAELQNSPGSIGGSPKVRSKVEIESVSRGADRRLSSYLDQDIYTCMPSSDLSLNLFYRAEYIYYS